MFNEECQKYTYQHASAYQIVVIMLM